MRLAVGRSGRLRAMCCAHLCTEYLGRHAVYRARVCFALHRQCSSDNSWHDVGLCLGVSVLSEKGDQKIKFRTCPAGELKFCIWRNSILLPHLASKASRSSSDVMLHTPLFLWSSISRLLACPFPVFLLGPCRARLRTTEFFLVAHSR